MKIKGGCRCWARNMQRSDKGVACIDVECSYTCRMVVRAVRLGARYVRACHVDKNTALRGRKVLIVCVEVDTVVDMQCCAQSHT